MKTLIVDMVFLFIITWGVMYFMFERVHEMQVQIMSWQMDINENQVNIDKNCAVRSEFGGL